MIFLGIDCGTQSTKTIALDWETGEVLASAQRPTDSSQICRPAQWNSIHRIGLTPRSNRSAKSIAKLGSRKEEVRGIGVSGQQHGLVVLDKNDQVVRPAKLWNDTTTGEQCDQITKHFGGPNAVIRPGRKYHAHRLYSPQDPVAASK